MDLKLSKSQAIYVALITGVFLVLAAILPVIIKGESKPQEQSWIVIKKIEYISRGSGDPTDANVVGRLIINVNGINYSYPSKAMYQQLHGGSSFPNEQFPLPVNLNPLHVSFELLSFRPTTLNTRPPETFHKYKVSKSTKVDIVTSLPYEGIYELYYINPVSARSQSVHARIYYEIR